MVWSNDVTQFHYPSHVPSSRRVIGQPYGTVVLIDVNKAVTAGHCFDVSRLNEDSWVTPYHPNFEKQLSSFQLAPLMSVQFQYELSCEDADDNQAAVYQAQAACRCFNVTKLLEYRQGKLDYAIFELSGNPGSIYGIAKIAIKTVNFTVDIPQHPAGLPKKIGYGLASCADVQCHDLAHYVDTLGGSSGSGIFYQGFLVGLHTYGTDSKNGGITMIALFKASEIIQDIVLHEAELYECYHDSSEFMKGFLLGLSAAGGLTGLATFKNKMKTSKKVMLSLSIGLFGGLASASLHDRMHKDSVLQELSSQSRYDGLSF